jgi:hypothetical protein
VLQVYNRRTQAFDNGRLSGCRLPSCTKSSGIQPSFYIVLLTIGYMVSRGLDKSGSRASSDA